MSIEIFCCYARKDLTLLNEHKAHLMPLQRQGRIKIWADTDIGAGIEWEKEIEKHLDTAQIILLLVSADFMNSEYCYSKEMQRAMEHHTIGEARVIPIILRPVDWRDVLGKLQALPTDGTPVIDRRWHTSDEALNIVAQGIRKVVDELARKAQEEERLRKAQEEKARKAHEEQSTLSTHKPTKNALPRKERSLAVGSVLMRRYEVINILNEGTEEHVYQVIDQQGYQRCWNCRSEHNSQGDEFCIDCGASLLEILYIMYEYFVDQSPDDLTVLHGDIVKIFTEQGRTYVIEQPSLKENAFPNGVHLLVADGSDAGKKQQNMPNEDTTLVLLSQSVIEEIIVPLGVFFVADGSGSQGKSQIASRIAISTIADHMKRELFMKPFVAEREGAPTKGFEVDALVSLLYGSIDDANNVLCQKNQHDKTDIRSTITGYMVVGETAYVANVGDSRCYLVRGGQLYQLTTDHSVVGQLVAKGEIEPDDVYTHPQPTSPDFPRPGTYA